jgi:hypothetical protein
VRKPPNLGYGVDDAPPHELPQSGPSNEETLASEEGERKLVGLIVRRLADRVMVFQKNGRSTALFHFDHYRGRDDLPRRRPRR